MKNNPLQGRVILFQRFYILQESLYHIVLSHQDAQLENTMQFYAHGLATKCLLHALSIRKDIDFGGSWESATDGKSYNYVVDPLSITSVVRSLYECMLTFNHVFVNAHDEPERELRYYFWQLETSISKLQSKPIPNSERDPQFREGVVDEVNKIVDHMLNTELVINLTPASQQIIRDKRKLFSTKWTYYVDGNKLVDAGGLSGLQARLEVNQSAIENMYKIFSLQVHPMAYSAYMASTMFAQGEKEAEPENFKLMDSTINFCLSIIALTIYDYCQYSLLAKKAFDGLPEVNKKFINSVLYHFKGPAYHL